MHSLRSHLSSITLVLACALVTLALQGFRVEAISAGDPCGKASLGKRFSRTELFLGLSKPDGSAVTDAEFQQFVDAEVTPRFPDGFTVVAANGQFRHANGVIVRENARVLVVLHAPHGGQKSASIERIRAAYKTWFRQESVLRVDGESCASF